MAKKKSPSWESISSYYAGRPVSINFQDTGGAGGLTYVGSGNVTLSPKTKQFLDAFLTNRKDVDGSVRGLVTLLHESMHNRNFHPSQDGFQGPEVETQAMALGSELLPDLLQRFFGIPVGSKLSNSYLQAAKKLPTYQAAYAFPGPKRWY